MKKISYTEEKIIGEVKQMEAGRRRCPPGGHPKTQPKQW